MKTTKNWLQVIEQESDEQAKTESEKAAFRNPFPNKTLGEI